MRAIKCDDLPRSCARHVVGILNRNLGLDERLISAEQHGGRKTDS